MRWSIACRSFFAVPLLACFIVILLSVMAAEVCQREFQLR